MRRSGRRNVRAVGVVRYMAKMPLQRLSSEPAKHEHDEPDPEPDEIRAIEAEHDEAAPRRIIKRTISFLHLDDG